MMSSREVRISVRCLLTTSWYLINQMCTFLPGLLLYGCDRKENGSIQTECGEVTKIWFRIVLLLFYQLQFLKPSFYMMMDRDLAVGVRKFYGRVAHKMKYYIGLSKKDVE